MSKKDRPYVSVIVPVYNVSQYIEMCIETLVAQTLKNIEIILVDDGSTDSSGEICDCYEKLYDNIKVIHDENNGLGMARNKGLEIAKGDYIGFVDSDDFVSKRMYETLYNNAIQNNADISYCAWRRFTTECNIRENEEKVKSTSQLKIWSGETEIRQYLLDRIGYSPESQEDNYYGASVCGGIYKRCILDENKIRFVSEKRFIAEDILFDIDIIMRCKKIVHSNEILYFYRYNPSSLTTVYRSDRYEKNLVLYKEMYNRLTRDFLRDECFNSMSRYLLTTARIGIIQEVLFSKKNGRIYAKKRISKICNNDELQYILGTYPYEKLPPKYKYLCFLEKKKAAGLILFLVDKFYIKRKKYDT